jgi:hypothetical protein
MLKKLPGKRDNISDTDAQKLLGIGLIFQTQMLKKLPGIGIIFQTQMRKSY